MAADVAVGDDADQPTGRIDHADAAEALGAHHHDRLGHRRFGRHQRQRVQPMHQVADQAQASAQLAARMQHAEMAVGEAAPLKQRHGERIAQGHLQCGRCGRRIERIGGFRGFGQDQHDVGGMAQRAVRHGGDGDQRDRETLGVADDRSEFAGLAGLGQRHHHVVDANHAQVAMGGLGGVDEERRLAGGGQGRGDLAADVAGLADPGQHHPALGGGEGLDRPGEVLAQAGRQPGQGVGLDTQHAPAGGDGVEIAHLPVRRPSTAAAARGLAAILAAVSRVIAACVASGVRTTG